MKATCRDHIVAYVSPRYMHVTWHDEHGTVHHGRNLQIIPYATTMRLGTSNMLSCGEMKQSPIQALMIYTNSIRGELGVNGSYNWGMVVVMARVLCVLSGAWGSVEGVICACRVTGPPGRHDSPPRYQTREMPELSRTWKLRISSGPRFNIKMSSYQYRESHCGDKTIVRSSYLHNGISYIGKTTFLYWIRALVIRSSRPSLYSNMNNTASKILVLNI